MEDRHRNPNINIREIILLGNQPVPGQLQRINVSVVSAWAWAEDWEIWPPSEVEDNRCDFSAANSAHSKSESPAGQFIM